MKKTSVHITNFETLEVHSGQVNPFEVDDMETHTTILKKKFKCLIDSSTCCFETLRLLEFFEYIES